MKSQNSEDCYPLQFIKGIGPKRAEALAQEGILTQEDLLNYFPRAYFSRNAASTLNALAVTLRSDNIFDETTKSTYLIKSETSVIARIREKKLHNYGKNRRMLKFIIADASGGSADVIFWNFTDYYNNTYQVNELITVSGTPQLDDRRRIQFNHPEVEKFSAEDEISFENGQILPIYKITQALKKAHFTSRQLREIVAKFIKTECVNLEETLPESILKEHNFPGISNAILSLHFPEKESEVTLAKNRMKFEEIFYYELMLAMQKQGMKATEVAPTLSPKSPLARKLIESLPFKLTGDQKKVLREIVADFTSGRPMNRLLQGDVGSGKTIVALLAMLSAIDNGLQTAFLAPTEILAEQHYNTLQKYVEGSEINIVQLVGGQRVKVRREVLSDIESGKANIIVGTHALFESEIAYRKLGFFVIDEQHRFGVAQRANLKTLAEKSFQGEKISPHILVMSATPIPRTLSMTVYGDLDVSIIREMPKDRKPIKTRVLFESKLPDCMEFIRKHVSAGRQAYIVYPLVDKSEKLELKAATEHYEEFKEAIFPEFKCGLLHGQMFWYEKDEVMKAFLNKEYQILIATTVIEVGIDVANATVMLIENAERFGLSQLHQLRGRVGRGSEQSYCFLATKDNFQYAFAKKDNLVDEKRTAVIRLKTMEETTDGFKIAEVDMQLRGPGDMLGTKQSGLPPFKHIDLIQDGDIITNARHKAFEIIEKDPHLRLLENYQIRMCFTKLNKNHKSYFDVA